MLVCFTALSAVFGQDYSSSSKSYPGGIVFSNGKDAIYWEPWASSQGSEVNLTSDLKSVSIQAPFAVDENGGRLAWLQNKKIWVRQLPAGKPYALGYDSPDGSGFIKWEKGARAMALSPDGTTLSFEGPCIKPKQVIAEVYDSNYVGTFLFDTFYQNSNAGEMHYGPRFGWKSRILGLEGKFEGPHVVEYGDGGRVIDTGRHQGTRIIRKSACFFAFSRAEAWQKGETFGFFIFNIDGKWGPISIRRLGNGPLPDDWGTTAMTCTENNTAAVTVLNTLEVPVSLAECQGLAVRPDGALVVWSGKNIYVVARTELENGIKGLRSSRHLSLSEAIVKVSAKNLTSSSGQAVEGTCMNWVSNDSFLYLDRYGNLQQWTNGVVTQKRAGVGNWYCYLSQSPLNTPTALGHGTGKATERRADIQAGYIRAGWWSGGNSAYRLAVGATDSQKRLEFCLTGKRDFTEVKDLSQYAWTKLSEKDDNKAKVAVPLGMVVLLREEGDKKVSLFKAKGFEPKTATEKERLVYDWESRIFDGKTTVAKTSKASSFSGRETKIALQQVSQGESVEVSKWAQLYKVGQSYPFSVGGRLPTFSWFNVTQVTNTNDPISLAVPMNEKLFGAYQRVIVDGVHVEDIVDPVSYFTKPFPVSTKLVPPGYATARFRVGQVVIVRYSKHPDEFFAVELVKFDFDTVVYKKRVWPDPDTRRVALASEHQR